eukprot:gb/GECG01009861.1/.p1 GENE.gb/GECG01009861.1/~~gb/GECG01009861.1/.p1  ORF type:complete len:272 (+),score=59.93 gb/GECG01009861.1/:1-816(+)
MFSFRNKEARENPEEYRENQIKEWRRHLRQECSRLEREAKALERQENEYIRDAKRAAKRNDMRNAKTCAKNVAFCRQQKNRVRTCSAQINSVSMKVKEQMGIIRATGIFQQSSEILQGMQNLVRFPEIAKSAKQLSMEMQKAGVMEEMTSDMLDDTMEMNEDNIDEDSEEIQNILREVLGEHANGGGQETENAETTQHGRPATNTNETAEGERERKRQSEWKQALDSLPTAPVSSSTRESATRSAYTPASVSASAASAGSESSPVKDTQDS